MKRTLTVLALTFFLILTGCATDDPAQNTTTPSEEATLTVLAAASLEQSFAEVAEEFISDHPEVTIDFNFAGSSTLVQNLQAGSPADVFASADETNMDKAQQADLLNTATLDLFASNTLVGIVPADNPASVSTLDEANAKGVNLVICAPQVPCGALSQKLAHRAGISLNAVSEEQQVSDVLGKVRSGQADAGLVYATDAALFPAEVNVFDIDGATEEVNHYPIARTANAKHPGLADAFIEFVRSETGQAILESNGFNTP